MAAAPGLPLWLLLLGMPWRVPGQPEPDTDRRFSEHKLCADADCSMLMHRGEALEDFTGPDCRFVNFKKGDNVYVYYKLAGKSPEVWAGSVGRIFGYFPKALIKVAHTYATKELQVPADETDFVCFDGGRDDFDNYNLEELLGFLELYSFATGDSKKAIEETSQHVGKPPEVPEERDSAPDSGQATAEERHSAFPGGTEEQEESYEDQETHAHAGGQTDLSQGEQSLLEPFEEMLQDKLKVQDGENNKTSNSSQISNEQEKIDAYKLLKKEMTLDLKTKFGSTADALVSDDETTRLVTSLEDDFDEELDVEYYVIGKEEEEENQENFDEIPLLTYTDEEDLKMPATSEVGQYSTDREQNSSEEDKMEVAQPLHIKNDEEDVAAWEDTVVSTATEGEERTGLDFENYNSEEEKEGDDGLVPDSEWGRPQLPADYTDSEKAEDGPPVAEVPKTNNEKHPEMDPELHDKGKGRAGEESERNLVQGKKGLEDEKKEDRTRQSSNLNLLVATEKGKETLKSVFGNKEPNPKGAAVPVSEGMVQEEKPGEPILEGGSERGWEHKAAGKQVKEEKIKQEATDVTPLVGEDQHNASKDGVEEEVDILVNGPKPHTVSVEHLSEKFKEEQLLKTQNEPRFSSPDEIGLSTGLEDEGPILGRNLSWQQEQDVAAAGTTPASEKTRLSAEEVTGDAVSGEFVQPKPGTPEAETVGQPGSAGVPGPHTEKPEADDADYPPEELLEDENAASAKQSGGKSPERPDRQFELHLQVPEGGVLGAVNTDAETEANKEKTSNILEIDRKNETVGKEEGMLGQEPGGLVIEKEESPPADKKAQRPPEGSDFPGKKTHQTPESGEVFQKREPAYTAGDSLKDPLKTSGLAEKPGVGPLQEDREDREKLVDTQSQRAAPEEQDGAVSPPTAGTAVEPGHSGHSAPFPIISSFFEEQQLLQRFQRYFDVHELEAMFQEMSLKLKLAQQESPPYSVEKALDKVFRTSESQILSAAEEMLDTRMAELRDLGMEENVFEEAAVLDDVQDLIYFVRYRHSTGRGPGPLAMAQPAEQGQDGPAEDVQPPLEDDPSQESTEDLKMQIPEEPGQLDQPVTSNLGVLEVSQKDTESFSPNTEKDIHPGVFGTEGTPDNDADDEEEPELPDEEPLENAVLFLQSFVSYLTKTLLSTLPGDVQSAPDFYGLPWKPVLITAFLGIVSFVIFFWRSILAVKSHLYQVTEQQISEKLTNLKKENADLVQKLSNYEQKIKESKKYVQETKKQNMILSDEAIKYKDKIKELEEAKENLSDKAKNLHLTLESQREQNAKNEGLILENKRSLDKLKDVIAMNASELSEVQIALNEARLSEEKVKAECHRVQEENAKLKKKKDQLQQEIKDLKKAYTELSEQIKSFEKSQKDLEVTLTQKEDNINALTNCITQLNWLDCESESERQNKTRNESDELANGEVGGDRNEKMKNQIKQMMDVSRTQTEISVIEEDLKLLQLKLRASMSSKCSLEDQVRKLEDDRSSLQSAKAGLEDENKTLQQKVEILNELYQQKEMALQKKLSQEEYERREREQRLSAADEKALSAAEEIKTYKWRIEELENELQKTERSFKDQLAANEKKAHDNWLKARAAERAMAEEKREAANLRHKLLELNQKVAMLQQEPVIVKPMPGRPSTQNPPRRGPLSQNGSFGPSPVSGGECSPPLRDPPARPLSATLNRRDVPRSEFDPGSGAAAMVNSSPRSSSPARGMDEGKVNMAAEGPPPFPGAPLMSAPMGGPVPPPIRYGPPPQLCGPFGPRPFPPPFGPGMRPPLGLREYAPGIPPGKRDVPFDPRGFMPGHPHFRPVASPGPREHFTPGPRPPPPPTYGPQDYPPPAARGLLPSGSGEEPHPASQSSGRDASQALKQSP